MFFQLAAFSQTSTPKPAASASSFANADNVFMIVGIVLVASFILIPVYSMSRAVTVLARKVSENGKQ